MKKGVFSGDLQRDFKREGGSFGNSSVALRTVVLRGRDRSLASDERRLIRDGESTGWVEGVWLRRVLLNCCMDLLWYRKPVKQLWSNCDGSAFHLASLSQKPTMEVQCCWLGVPALVSVSSTATRHLSFYDRQNYTNIHIITCMVNNAIHH